MTVTIEQTVSTEERFKVFLKLFSVLFSINLSDKEIQIINEFYWKHGGKINTESRKQVIEKLKITEFNLNNYLGKLRKRNVVSADAIHDKLNINIMAADKNLAILFNLKN